MPVTLSYPGVYIEEVSSGVRTITGVATSITAFIGRALRGPTNDPVRVQSFGEYERNFGGLWRDSTMSYAVQQFFQNGGSDALIVRVVNEVDGLPAKAATGAADTLNLVAASHGKWGNSLRVQIDYPSVKDDPSGKLFNLTVRDVTTGVTERFLNLSTESGNPRFVTDVLKQGSSLIRIDPLQAAPTARPVPSGTIASDPFPPGSFGFNADGSDGIAIGSTQISTGLGLEADKKGIWALEKADLFNLLCIPPFTFGGDLDAPTRSAAATYCEKRRAMYIVDPLNGWQTHSAVISDLDGTTWGLARSANAALYFPYMRLPDPLRENRLADFAPCGAVAGIIARTDAQRGVWKAPAGNDATLNGVVELTANLTNGEHGQLNPLGVNCLRAFPVTGRVMWGARTLKGADQLASEWKYLPVRRLALFLEESLYRGTQWAVFEPNDEPLWAQVRLNLGAFMHNLFRQGAFQGSSPREAYFVKCDKETTTQNEIDSGIVNIVVGFAPLKPAEFVVIKLQQIAGQIQA